jgi:hypothetical protein
MTLGSNIAYNGTKVNIYSIIYMIFRITCWRLAVMIKKKYCSLMRGIDFMFLGKIVLSQVLEELFGEVVSQG